MDLEPTKTVMIAGGSGLIGTRLSDTLRANGWNVRLMGRSPRSDFVWDPSAGVMPSDALQDCDVVINLAGAGIAESRWTPARKALLRDSRVDSTRLLAEAIARSNPRPRVWINASAVGYYGARGDEALTEDSASGDGFLPELCREWEDATTPASEAGIRTVLLRIGVVITPLGGALEKMLPAFRWGVGGVLGSGMQYLSWIGLNDTVRLVQFAIDNESLTGPVNATAPEPVNNAEFTKTLGKVLNRPTFLPAPSIAIRLALGELGQRLLLEGKQVLPKRAQEAGFVFEQPTLEACLRHELELGDN